MSGTVLPAAVDAAARLPLRIVAGVVAVLTGLVGGLVLVLWYGVVLPLLWLLVGVPVATVAALVTRRQHSSGHLRRRLRSHRASWRSNRGYRFARLRHTCRRVRRWGR